MKTAEIIRFPLFSGANDVTRTHDLLITNQLLYRLSYISIFTFGVADLILTNYDSFVSPISVNTRKVLCRKASGVFVFRGISPIWAGFG